MQDCRTGEQRDEEQSDPAGGDHPTMVQVRGDYRCRDMGIHRHRRPGPKSRAMAPGGAAAVVLMAVLATAVLALAGCSKTGQPVASAESVATTTAIGSTSDSIAPVTPTTGSDQTGASSTAARADADAAPAAGGTASVTTTAGTLSSVDPTRAAPGLAPVGLLGVNDPSCISDTRPVVLLHGTFSTVASNFATLSAALQAAGRCVYGIDYGAGGTGSVRTSAATVTGFIDEVLSATGADQVDVIAYSQGGLVLRAALRLDELAPDIAVAVLIAPSFHGTTSRLLDAIPAGACPACADQTAGSALLTELDGGGDLDGAVRYAVISTADDTIVTPVSSQAPQGAAGRVTSLVVQDACPEEQIDHIGLPADNAVVGWAIAALDADGSPGAEQFSCR
jgi:triacylglycerol lipase